MADAAFTADHRLVRGWLFAVAGLIFVMVLVGGTTRLTGSGLSIVEWQPVTGVIPPLSEEAWRLEFEKYKTIPQYREQNQGMTLDAFKSIYWWEWAHRLLGRIIGVAFIVPFVFFLWRGWIDKQLQVKLWGIFALGALQGLIGWWMVTSGLSQRVNVAHERLAIHLTLACLIYAAILWVAQGLRTAGAAVVPAGFRATALGLLALVLLQIYLGALVAGLRGGLIYNTWPLIDGAWVPAAERLFFLKPLWSNFFDNVLTVQFEHRMAAYALWLLAIGHAIHAAMTADRTAFNLALALATAITLQAGIGIITLLHAAPPLLALLHQGMAIVVLSLAVVHAQRLAAAGRRAEVAVTTLASRS
jgi:cytochrome c oxidase assembly protein subunit 15